MSDLSSGMAVTIAALLCMNNQIIMQGDADDAMIANNTNCQMPGQAVDEGQSKMSRLDLIGIFPIGVGLTSPCCDVQLYTASLVVKAVRSAKPQCECRVAAMGGTPALGAGMVLPKLSQHQLHSLSSTESPAARELHAAQGRPDEAASTSPPPSVNTPNNSPPWLVRTLVLVGTVTGQCSRIKRVLCVISCQQAILVQGDSLLRP